MPFYGVRWSGMNFDIIGLAGLGRCLDGSFGDHPAERFSRPTEILILSIRRTPRDCFFLKAH